MKSVKGIGPEAAQRCVGSDSHAYATRDCVIVLGQKAEMLPRVLLCSIRPPCRALLRSLLELHKCISVRLTKSP